MLVLKNLIFVAQFLSALGIIGLVLLQHGKGADMGAAFGSGSSGSLFGATGAANFLSRTTAILAVIFFISTLSLTFIGSHKPKASAGVLEGVITPVPASVGANAGKAALPPVDAPAPGQDVPK
ncbi:MAG: preprotein translocase subunit SecG [Glomeribacter sp. 1016415]|nr:preprotein translocase subunit SecG [Glomeribacter sp. 1016415]